MRWSGRVSPHIGLCCLEVEIAVSARPVHGGDIQLSLEVPDSRAELECAREAPNTPGVQSGEREAVPAIDPVVS